MSNSVLENQKKAEKIYAFNIDFKKIDTSKKNGVSYQNIGFYDELLNCDKKLKADKRDLSVTKTNGIKECVYCNKPIPDAWTTKVTYLKELNDIIATDNNFLNYLGKGNSQDERINYINTKYNKSEYNSLINKKIRLSDLKRKKPQLSIIVNENEKDSLNDPSKFLTKRNLTMTDNLENKKNYNPRLSTILNFNENYERQIMNILDEYKMKYPLSLPKLNNKTHNKNDINFNNKTEKTIDNKEENKNQTSNSFMKLINLKKKIKPLTKSEVLKGTIYNGLIPRSTLNTINSSSFSLTKKSKNRYNYNDTNKSNITNNIYLNSNSDLFNKETKITNPEIEKKLKDIKYYGPHFSHCPPCRNRNMNFYQTMEEKTCLNLLNYLKKVRTKSMGSKINLNNQNEYKNFLFGQ